MIAGPFTLQAVGAMQAFPQSLNPTTLSPGSRLQSAFGGFLLCMSKHCIEFPIGELHRLFDYCPETGVLTWKVKPCRGRHAGCIAGYPNGKGYRGVNARGRKLQVHRIAFAMHYGRWPEADVDHISGVRSDNRISNLREATRSQNTSNMAKHKDNTSGCKGVTWDVKRAKWQAQIMHRGQYFYLGKFTDIKEAEAVVRAKRVKRHGEFTNHG